MQKLTSSLFLALTLLLSATTYGQQRTPVPNDSEEILISFKSPIDGNVGYIDLSGRIRISPRFSGKDVYNEMDADFREFSEGFGGVLVGEDKYSYINTKGELITNLQFDGIRAFSEGFAAVLMGDKYSYINTKGELITSLKFDGVGSFSQGLGLVTIEDKSGYINETGQIAIPLTFTEAGLFEDGLANACTESGCGYIDTKGKFIIEPKYESVEEFSEGLAAVRIGGKYGYIDLKGTLVIQPRFGSAHYFVEGLALVGKPEDDVEQTDQRLWPEGYINSKGELVINTKSRSFLGVTPFSEGLAVIQSKRYRVDPRYGYINRKGRIVIRPRYYSASLFSEGLAAVDDSGDQAHGNYRYIDKRGRVVINRRLNSPGEFYEGVAWVELHSPPDRRSHVDPTMDRLTEALIDKRGRVIFRGRWLYATAEAGDGDDEAPDLVEITIGSNPPGAKVFLVPLIALDDDPTILNGAKLHNYRTETDTVYKNKVYEQVYRVVLELNGQREIRPLDVYAAKDNTVMVKFEIQSPRKPAAGPSRKGSPCYCKSPW